MKTATIIRQPSSDDGTFGMLNVDTGESWHSLELPWRNNDHGTSCIPSGVYTCHWINSPKHGPCYEVMNVPNRSMVEIHSANFAGDVALGKQSQLLGCIALGKEVGEMTGQQAILNSKLAVAQFEQCMDQQDFELTIKDA
jgi:hypothetical protein